MLIDSVNMFDGAIDDGVIEKGNSLPPAVQSKQGQLFYLAQNAGSKVAGLYVFDGVNWVSGSKNQSGGDGGGAGSTLAEPDSISYEYNEDGFISTVTEKYGDDDKVFTYFYDADDNVYQVQSVFLGVTRTETYTFDDEGNVESMTAVIS